MRKLFGVLAIGVFFVAGQASAAALTSATLSFGIGTLPPSSFVGGAGISGTATSDLSASLNAGTAIAGVATTTVPLTAAAPITVVQVAVTKNDGQTFVGASPAKVGGNLLFHGNANVFGGATASTSSASGCVATSYFPPTLPCTNPAPLLAIPLQIGAPNTQYAKATLVSITAIGAGWTAGATTITGITTTTPTNNITNVAGTAMATGDNGLTPGGAGTLVLVSPTKILTTAAGNLAAFSTLTLTYVPEPGTLLLLGAGIAGLTALGRRRI